MIKKLLLRLIGKDYDYKIEKLRKRGAEIGNIRISGDITIDNNWPFLLHIGNNTHLTNNVTILCHDYSWSVVKGYDGTLMGGGKTCLHWRQCICWQWSDYSYGRQNRR